MRQCCRFFIAAATRPGCAYAASVLLPQCCCCCCCSVAAASSVVAIVWGALILIIIINIGPAQLWGLFVCEIIFDYAAATAAADAVVTDVVAVAVAMSRA